jgi:hypothetical protein
MSLATFIQYCGCKWVHQIYVIEVTFLMIFPTYKFTSIVMMIDTWMKSIPIIVRKLDVFCILTIMLMKYYHGLIEIWMKFT